jgi:hypothetical protein
VHFPHFHTHFVNMGEIIKYLELRVQLLIFFFMYMSQVIKCANSQRIKLEKERLVRLKRRKIQQRCRINRFKKLILRHRKLFFCILMNLTSHTVNREIWVKPHGTDIYNDILNWTPHDWYVNIRMSQQAFNHIWVCSPTVPVLAGHPKVQLIEEFPRRSTLLLFYSP